MRGFIFIALASSSLLLVACATPIEIPDDPLEGNTVSGADAGSFDSQRPDPDAASSDQASDRATADQRELDSASDASDSDATTDIGPSSDSVSPDGDLSTSSDGNEDVAASGQ